jgi:hypothetical protein
MLAISRSHRPLSCAMDHEYDEDYDGNYHPGDSDSESSSEDEGYVVVDESDSEDAVEPPEVVLRVPKDAKHSITEVKDRSILPSSIGLAHTVSKIQQYLDESLPCYELTMEDLKIPIYMYSKKDIETKQIFSNVNKLKASLEKTLRETNASWCEKSYIFVHIPNYGRQTKVSYIGRTALCMYLATICVYNRMKTQPPPELITLIKQHRQTGKIMNQVESKTVQVAIRDSVQQTTQLRSIEQDVLSKVSAHRTKFSSTFWRKLGTMIPDSKQEMQEQENPPSAPFRPQIVSRKRKRPSQETTQKPPKTKHVHHRRKCKKPRRRIRG